jgi:phosphate transport system permease protein
LGGTKRETILGVVLPAASGGILAAFVLALSRAVGETMAVALAAGGTPRLTLDPRQGVETMTAFIVNTSEGDAPAGTLRYTALFAVGALLFVSTLVLNAFARRLVERIAR